MYRTCNAETGNGEYWDFVLSLKPTSRLFVPLEGLADPTPQGTHPRTCKPYRFVTPFYSHGRFTNRAGGQGDTEHSIDSDMNKN